jgi:hypothetical protein
MNSIKHACTLNNQGVNLLVSGECSKAVKAFQSAVGLLKVAAHEAEKNALFTGMDESCDDVSLPYCESTLTVTGLQGLHCYVYDHGILIPGNVSNEESEATISLYIAVVLFNLALASHSRGIALGRDALLKKASVLYSLVVELLNRHTMPEDKSTTILTLLALNNKAQIRYEQCDYVQSIDCMRYISQIVGSGRGFHYALNPDDLEGIMLNVMLLRTPSGAQAA